MKGRFGSVFTGVGGFDLAFERAGAQIAWQVENDLACQRVLAHHWPDVPRYGDVKEVNRDRLIAELGERADIDVLVGGFPCSDLSVAGRRAGLAGAKSGLFFEFMRLADEFSPRWLLIENVPGLLSSCGCPDCRPSDDEADDEQLVEGRTRPDHRGRDMATVLGTLGELGYGWAYRVLDAQYFGVAQRRRRVFIVGCAGGRTDRAVEVLFESESCSGDTPPRREKGQGVAALTANGVGTCGPDDNQGQAGHLIPEFTSAVTSKWHKGSGGPAGDETQNLIPEVFNETGQSWWNGPEEHVGTLSARDYKDARTAIAFSQKDYGADASEEVSPTLRAMGHDQSWENGGGQVAVAYSVYPESGQGSDLVARETDVVPSLSAEGLAKQNDRKTLVAYSTKLHHTKSNQAGKFYEEYTPSVQYNSPPPAVAFSENQRGEILETEQAHQLSGVGGKPGQGYPAVREGLQVRRLLPLECERLQSFPDDWTAPCADSARYKQMGNAVCVNVAEWIARRLLKADGS